MKPPPSPRCHHCGTPLVPLYRHTWTTWRTDGHDHCSHACATATLTAESTTP